MKNAEKILIARLKKGQTWKILVCLWNNIKIKANEIWRK